MKVKVMGIDPAGLEKNITGMCVLVPNHEVELYSVRRDEEIIRKVEEAQPAVVAIDAPLSFYGKAFRDCDLEMRKYCSILPLTFKGMQQLTERGMKLAKIVKEKNIELIEVYPHATKVALHEKEGGEELLRELAKRAPVKNEHEYDAILCAITAKFYYEGKYRAFGKEDKIIVPDIM
jgi:predicted nuclease with RNAse H fold